ncbi:MAG: O-antigen ligase family protein [Candidatus Levybacteria bacterium]|nr:O-antigen ligase family protein [Candidatus Levybacteria bacterium]
MAIFRLCNKIIEYSFYALFLLVPLAFTSVTSELFEFNKMWLTFILTILILASWTTKMILQKRISIQKTPLDIPILLFLLSQIISTIFSLDSHTSLWGYYSRFNGGLLSIFSYISLYYAFVSNFEGMQTSGGRSGKVPDSAHLDERRGALAGGKLLTGPDLTLSKMVKRALYLSLASGVIVALWGLPSHFGFDPTCLIFRGNFDVSCWTNDFQPKIRIFSTLGQPNWMAAYMAILIPITLALAIKKSKWFLVLFALFFLDLLYTRSQSGFLGLVGELLVFVALYFLIEKGVKKTSLKLLLPSAIIFLIIVFFVGTPIGQLNLLTFSSIQSRISSSNTKQVQKPTPVSHSGLSPSGSKTSGPSLENNITGSQEIRSIVWKGALDIWKHNPIFGTGVETFAFAYYQYRPASHNLTSEWNFLYNKAHNEYLNYLATTGIFGLGTYLFIIGYFLTIVILNLFQDLKSSKTEMLKLVQHDTNKILITALLAGYVSILVTNFFGFSVVIVNIYLFLIPAFVFVLAEMLKPEQEFIFPRSESRIRNYELRVSKISLYQWTFILFIILASSFMILNLFRFWQADVSYAYGSNLDRAGNFQQAYPYLHDAVSKRSDEPVFSDEMSINDAVLAAELLSQNKPEQASQTAQLAASLAQEAILTSNQIVASHPNNVVFWKSRVRIFYTLAQIDSRYLPSALDAIKEAQKLAPTDANISYNLGVLYGQNGDLDKGIEVLQNTIKLRPAYRDAYYALGLFYHQKALDKNGKVIDFELQNKAIKQMKYILDKLLPNDASAKQAIDAWER